MRLGVLSIALAFVPLSPCLGDPVIYPWPTGAPKSQSFLVSINGIPIPVLSVQGFSWCSFGFASEKGNFSAPVVVDITPIKNGARPTNWFIKSAVARPLRKLLKPIITANQTAVQLRLTSPVKLAVEISLGLRSNDHTESINNTCSHGARYPSNRTVCPGVGAGVTPQECSRLGCCFSPTPNPDPSFFPWCYEGSDAPPPADRPPLFLFAEPPETKSSVPTPDTPGVVYFGPGMHDPNPNVSAPWCPLSATKPTLYLAPGAYLRTGINCYGHSDYNIIGRGVISGEKLPRVKVDQCLVHMSGGRVRMSGVTILAAPKMQVCIGGGIVNRPHEVRGVKLITPRSPNSDGIHAGPAQLIDDCFVVANDDALDVGQGSYWSLITNTTVWNTWGSALLISWNAQHNTGNAVVDGLDVIRWQGDEYNNGNEAVILLQHGCTGNLSNFTFSNIRIENTGRNSRLIGWSIGPTYFSCGIPGCACATNATNDNLGSVSGITLRDVTVDGVSVGLNGGHNFIRGFSPKRKISNVHFERLSINGTVVTSAASMGLDVGPFVSNVTFSI